MSGAATHAGLSFSGPGFKESLSGRCRKALPESATLTFYIENIPMFVNNSALRRLLYGRWSLPGFKGVVDVYIPHSKNRNGKRYGFVELAGVEDDKAMEAALNEKKIGASKLTCKIGRGRRIRIKEGGRETEQKVYHPERERTVPVKRWKPVSNPDTSIVVEEAEWPSLPNCQGREVEVRVPLKSIPLSIPTENHAWLELCLIGVMKKIEHMSDIHKRVAELGWMCEPKILGSGMVCLEFNSKKVMEEALADQSSGVESLFYKVMPWHNVATESGRCIWVQCTGVPIQCWGEKTFQDLASAVGTLITVDENTSMRRRMDVARFLVATDKSEVDIKIRGVLEGNSFVIHCKEEPLHGLLSCADWCKDTRFPEDKKEGNVDEEDVEFVENTVTEEHVEENQCVIIREGEEEGGVAMENSVTSPGIRSGQDIEECVLSTRPERAGASLDLNRVTQYSGSSQGHNLEEGEIASIGEALGFDQEDREEMIKFERRRRAVEAAC